MPNMVTLRDLVNTFTEQELDMSVPIDFKNPTTETIKYANQYNAFLAAGDWQGAYNYRLQYADILEPMIHDARALNIQQAMMINTYLFAKGEKSATNTSYDNTNTGIDEDTVQKVLDSLVSQLGGYKIQKVASLPSSPDSKTIYLVTG